MISFANIITANPTLLIFKYLYNIYIEIEKIQHIINSAFYGAIHLQKNIIWVY